MPRVYNISDRTGLKPIAVNIGLIKIRPGKFKDVPSESINSKTQMLHGKLIWIGSNLPKQLEKKAPLQKKVLCMEREQISSYLQGQTIEYLIELTKATTPALKVVADAPFRRYVYALTAACCSSEYILDPESFFWLGKWNKLPNGDYQEI